MAYEEEIDYQQISDAAQQDLIANSLDVTSLPLTEDTENSTVQVTTVVDGIPAQRRMAISVLTSGVSEAAELARQKAEEASQAAALATSAITAAQTAAQNANDKADRATQAIEEFEAELATYKTDVDEDVKKKIRRVAEMAEEGSISVALEDQQLFEDFRQTTGYTGSYNDFLIMLGQKGGGGSIEIDTAMSPTSVNAVQNKVITGALTTKQDLLNFMTNQDMNELFNSIL